MPLRLRAGLSSLSWPSIWSSDTTKGRSRRRHAVQGDPTKIAIYPLAVPYLLNPVGITILIVASDSVASVASVGLVLALVLLVAAFDYLIFANIDKLAKRLNPTSLVISEVVFGILLMAVAVPIGGERIGFARHHHAFDRALARIGAERIQ